MLLRATMSHRFAICILIRSVVVTSDLLTLLYNCESDPLFEYSHGLKRIELSN